MDVRKQQRRLQQHPQVCHQDPTAWVSSHRRQQWKHPDGKHSCSKPVDWVLRWSVQLLTPFRHWPIPEWPDPHTRGWKLVSQLVGTLSPVNHKGLHQGWTQTSLSPSYSFHKSLYHKSWFVLACLHSAGTQHGNLHPAGWPVLFCRPTQEPCVSHSQHRKNRKRF